MRTASLVLGLASKLTTTKNARSSSHWVARNVSIKLTPRWTKKQIMCHAWNSLPYTPVHQKGGCGATYGLLAANRSWPNCPTSSCPRWLCICAQIPQCTSQANGAVITWHKAQMWNRPALHSEQFAPTPFTGPQELIAHKKTAVCVCVWSFHWNIGIHNIRTAARNPLHRSAIVHDPPLGQVLCWSNTSRIANST